MGDAPRRTPCDDATVVHVDRTDWRTCTSPAHAAHTDWRTCTSPVHVAHADWGTEAAKQWVAVARWTDSHDQPRWQLDVPRRVGPTGSLRERMGVPHDGLPVLLGLDVVLGVPARWATAAQVTSFPSLLRSAGMPGPFADVLRVCDHPHEVSVARPFFPRRADKGRRRAELAEGLGIPFHQLYRRCELPTPHRRAACPLFWTLGANQVGKATINAWQMLQMQPPDDLAIWPFDGPLDAMLAAGPHAPVVVAETYPAEAAGWFGITGPVGKRRQDGRRAAAPALQRAAAELGVTITPALSALLADGFGPSPSAEDAFDTVVGVLGAVAVASAARAGGEPRGDATVTSVEGWVLGLDAGDAQAASDR